ncbi:hypothetical protein [Burkholderia glumae]|uniref:hypothetical protein n=1 Tax=Burkholderia glumae TaxID=337 RepID=UPI00214F7EDB|nr:hypothetical protein [Burkholderia glumae]
MLTQEQINEAVTSAMPDILAGLRREIAENALYQAKQSAQAAVSKAVSDWITENIVPEVLKALAEGKDGLVGMAPMFAQSMVTEMTSAFTDSIKKNLENSWDRKKIFEALLG